MKHGRFSSVLGPAAAAIVLCNSGWGAQTQGVSPGGVDRLVQVEGRCPAFFWEASPDAEFVEVVVYRLPDRRGTALPGHVELTADDEVLYVRLPGGATGWTPSLEDCLEVGGGYVWFVRAVPSERALELAEAGEWSDGRFFSVAAALSVREVEQALEVLRRYMSDGGVASTGVDRLAGRLEPAAGGSGVTARPPPVSESGAKAMTSAKTAIRGDVSDAVGETYGVVGISNSPDGAGVGAANTNGGPDLVLDGSADFLPDALLSESGIDRPWGTPQTFNIENSVGAGMTLQLDGVEVVTVATDQDTLAGLTCDSEEVAKWNGSTWTCAPDEGTSYTAGSGLDLIGSEFSVDTSTIQSRVNGSCAAGSAIRAIGVGGTVVCEVDNDSGGDITAVLPGAGLSGGGSTGAVELAIDALGVTNAMLDDDSVTSGKLMDGEVGVADIGARPSARAHHSSQSLFASITNFAWFETEDWDNGTFHEDVGPSSAYFVPPEPGLYLVAATLAFNQSVDNLRRDVRILHRNAAQTVTTVIASVHGYARSVSLSGVYAFQGDGDRAYVSIDVTADQTMSTAPSNLTITWMAPLP